MDFQLCRGNCFALEGCVSDPSCVGHHKSPLLPCFFTQNILIRFVLFYHGFGLHSFDSLQVEFLRMLSERKTWCSIADLQCFKRIAHQHSNVRGTLSRGQQRCCGSLALCWLYLLSDLLPGHDAGSWADHTPHWDTSASWDIPGWSISLLCSLLIIFSPSEPNLLRRWSPVTCSSHAHARAENRQTFLTSLFLH